MAASMVGVSGQMQLRAAPPAAPHASTAQRASPSLQGHAQHRAGRRSRASRRAGAPAAPAATGAASAAAAAPASEVSAEDPWVARTLAALAPGGGGPPPPPELARLRADAARAAATLRLPTTRNEEYRFTDVAPVAASAAAPPPAAAPAAVAAAAARHELARAPAARLVVVDGAVDARASAVDAARLPPGAYVGAAAGAPPGVLPAALGAQARGRGGPFATLAGALARDAAVVYVPEGAAVEGPIHVLYLSSSAAPGGGGGVRAVSAPRLLAVLEAGASAEVVEEFAPLAEGGGAYLVAAVAEVELDDGAALKHSVAQLDAGGALWLKSTLVAQGAGSRYALAEARLGGALTRHDVGVQQAGAATATAMKHFVLCGDGQTHDVHTRLELDHPDGKAAQLHKCIAAAPSSRGVFDGNVRVGRLAQRTDAGQVSRNLLLAPRATVNVKPNLQIVADDVRCTHGCSVSDLEEEQLFYLAARGVEPAAARALLVYSFGGEIVAEFGDDALAARAQAAARALLAALPLDLARAA